MAEALIKVKLVRPMLVGRHNRESGEVVAVPEARAHSMVKDGSAVLADAGAKAAPYSAASDDPGDIAGKAPEGEHGPDKATSKPHQQAHKAIKPH